MDLPNDIYPWESLPMSPPDRLASERSSTSAPKVSRVTPIAILQKINPILRRR